MKRNIILLFSLIGLVALEYGCTDNYGDGGGGQARGLIIIGINETLLVEIDSNEQVVDLVADSAIYNRFKIATTFDDAFVKVSSSTNYSAYAAPTPTPSVSLELDSIIIRNVATSDSLDITSDFKLGHRDFGESKVDITNDSLLRMETAYLYDWGQFSYHLFMTVAPDSAADYKFEITYYATNGDVFIDETKSIIVTP
jgi:hypothetical protein